jgi:hypothetical protein
MPSYSQNRITTARHPAHTSSDLNQEDAQRERSRMENSRKRMDEQYGAAYRKAIAEEKSGQVDISQPGDDHEKEADAAADKVANNEPAEVTSSLRSEGISSKSDIDCKEEGAGEKLMAKSEDGKLKGTDELQATLDSSKGSGQAMDDNTKGEMEEKMNADLSDVRIHTGGKAHEMAEGINAKAFTHGQDVYFKNGNYDPESNEGKKLLAHELAHTQQQKGGVKRKIQRKEDDLLHTGARMFLNAMPHTILIKHLVAKWDQLTPEQQEKEAKNHFLGKLVDINNEKGQDPPWWTEAIAMPSLPGIPAPSLATAWPYVLDGLFGYYSFMYTLPPGKYSALMKRALLASTDPDFLIGAVKGVFKGIGSWFADLGDIVVFIGELAGMAWDSLVSLPENLMNTHKNIISAAEWLKENNAYVRELIMKAIMDPKMREEMVKSVKASISGAAKHAGWSAGQALSGYIDKPYAEQGEDMGSMFGYMIPEVLVAVFTEGIGTVVKNGLKAVQMVRKALKVGGKITKALAALARTGLATLKKLWGALKLPPAVKKMLDDVVEFVKKKFDDVNDLKKEKELETKDKETGKKDDVKEENNSSDKHDPDKQPDQSKEKRQKKVYTTSYYSNIRMPQFLKWKQEGFVVDEVMSNAKRVFMKNDLKHEIIEIVLNRDCPGWVDPDWGVNRLKKELYNRGFRLLREADSGGGLLLINELGEEFRIMPKPKGYYNTDIIEKHLNNFYLRYKKGRYATEGKHTTIINKD